MLSRRKAIDVTAQDLATGATKRASRRREVKSSLSVSESTFKRDKSLLLIHCPHFANESSYYGRVYRNYQQSCLRAVMHWRRSGYTRAEIIAELKQLAGLSQEEVLNFFKKEGVEVCE
jgi:hypothetical protein